LGLLLGLMATGFFGILHTRLQAMSAKGNMTTVGVEYQFVGDDLPSLETLEGNPNWSTDRIFNLFRGGQWQFFADDQFVFQPGPSASVRRDLFPMSGTYSVEGKEILFRGERRSDSTSAIASVDGILTVEGEQATVELVYAVMALDSQRVIRVSQVLLPAVEIEPIESMLPSALAEEPLFNGTWQVPDLETLALQQHGQQVEGTYSGRGGGELSGQVEGSWLAFTFRDRQGSGRGFLRAVAQGRTLAGLWKTESGDFSNLLATRTSGSAVDEAELATLDRQELKYKGYDLALASQCDRAIPYLDRARLLYRVDRDDPDIWEASRDSSLIDELNISTRLIHCHFQLKSYEPLLDALIDTIEIRRILSDRPHLSSLAQENLDTLAPRLENWRSRLANDTARISAVDQGQRMFDTLVRAFVELESYEEALVASEQSRARAFADLLYRKLSTEQAAEFVTAQTLSIEDIQRIAREQNATLVEYFFASDVQKLYTWVVQPTGDIDFRSVAVKGDLDNLIQQTQASFGRRGFELVTEGETSAELDLLPELYQLLIKPIEALLPNEESARIIFVPQGQLFLVPFPALKEKDGAHLIERHTMQTAPSIQSIDLIHQRYDGTSQQRDWQSEDFLIVGDPEMPKVRLSADEEPRRLSSLPGAREEATAIGRLFGAALLTGSAANERQVTEQMASARVIHLATHGLLEYGEAGQIPGALAFASIEEFDGLLTSSDILDLDLRADLVVLSACDTGRGEITGDGVVGLSRSLLQAGAASVVVSLWAVPDAPTAALMTEFYERLKQGEEKSQALRQAMLSTMQNHPAPVSWAAFTLIGEDG
jgi:CHAT domain-containing protein